MNVFELNATIKAVQEKDLDPETLKDTLESLELPRNEKLDNVATWIENNQMKLDWLKAKNANFQTLNHQLRIKLIDFKNF